MVISYEGTKRFSEDDYCGGSILPSALMRAFQWIAGEHVESTGNGVEALKSRGLVWVLTGLHYLILSEPCPGQDYTLSTYPRPNGSRLYDRDFYITEGDRTLVKATSQWCLMNYLTRRIEQVELGYDGEFRTDAPFPEKLQRLRPRELPKSGSYTVQTSDLDSNDHMNNCRYADIAVAELGNPGVKELTVTFAREARLGDTLELSVSEDHTAVAGTKPDGTLIFALKVAM